METANQKGLEAISRDWLKILLCGLTLLAAVETTRATPPISTDSPLGFFTNVAARVLLTELNVDLNHIQVYPTNQYTPAVHRLLQVTVNIYDATTTNYYPSVFRPLFTQDASSNVFVTGYTNVFPMADPASDLQFILPVDAGNVMGTNVAANVYGIPWIIGAKKGFPNFNAFTMENIFSITRRLLVTRPDTNTIYFDNPDAYTISQQLVLGVTNMLMVECWNSYRSAYTNAQPIQIFATVANAVWLTNDEGVSYPISIYTPSTLTVSNWPGYGTMSLPQPTSFQIPLFTSTVVLPASIYHFGNINQPFTADLPTLFATNTLMLNWGLLVTNRLRVVMVEKNPVDGFFHVIDYVQLAGPNSSHNVTADIQGLYDTAAQNGLGFNGYNNQWDPNLDNGGMPYGIENQLTVSLGQWLDYGTLITYWTSQDPNQVIDQIDGFLAFLGYTPLYGGDSQQDQYITLGANSLAMQAPYTPTALIAYETQWEANDPLVHYLASDLTDFSEYTGPANYVFPLTFGVLNFRYWPWAGNPQFLNDPNPYNLAVKDPLVHSSDDWNFPTGQPLSANWLGQVHRGTPWQTIYLKNQDVPSTTVPITIGTNTLLLPVWQYLTGNLNSSDAANTKPKQDWHLASLLASMFNTNDFRQLVSVNNPDPNAWLVLLDGLTALTNSSGHFNTIIISSNSPQASIIANAIQAARSGQPNQFFRDSGDILTTPQLSTTSPFLDLTQTTNGINDAAYEEIPSQLLSLIRSDSIGSITNNQMGVQFTGYDGHNYALEVSTNLVDWTDISTNSPIGGVLNFPVAPTPDAGAQFFRSVLLN